MARNLSSESEFGLPVMSRPDGTPVEEGATGHKAVTAFGTDADAIAEGAAGVDAVGSQASVAQELRAVYATDPDPAAGPAATAAGTS